MKFDALAYLRHLGIPYKEKGRNVMREHVAIACTKHDDKSMHLNIKVDGSHAYCLVCGHHTFGAFRVIGHTLGNDNMFSIEISRVIAEFPWQGEPMLLSEQRSEEQRPYKETISRFNILWNSFSTKLSSIAKRYLEYRGVELSFAQEFGIREGSQGVYDWCVVLPVKDVHGTVVNFVARKMGSRKQYLNCPGNLSISPMSACLFGLYEARKLLSHCRVKYLVIVEGPFDALKLLAKRVPTVALMKKTISQEQRVLLGTMFSRELPVFLALDADVKPTEVWQREQELNMFDVVRSVKFQGVKDVGECSDEDVARFVNLLNKVVTKGCEAD